VFDYSDEVILDYCLLFNHNNPITYDIHLLLVMCSICVSFVRSQLWWAVVLSVFLPFWQINIVVVVVVLARQDRYTRQSCLLSTRGSWSGRLTSTTWCRVPSPPPPCFHPASSTLQPLPEPDLRPTLTANSGLARGPWTRTERRNGHSWSSSEFRAEILPTV